MPRDVFDRILRPLRKGPVSSAYPRVRTPLGGAGRGLPQLDETRCAGTATCVSVCPTGAISLTEEHWAIDAGACVFCEACASACPNGAISLTAGTFELAAFSRSDLVVRVERRPR